MSLGGKKNEQVFARQTDRQTVSQSVRIVEADENADDADKRWKRTRGHQAAFHFKIVKNLLN